MDDFLSGQPYEIYPVGMFTDEDSVIAQGYGPVYECFRCRKKVPFGMLSARDWAFCQTCRGNDDTTGQPAV